MSKAKRMVSELVYRCGAFDDVVAVADYKLIPARKARSGLERKRSAVWHNANRNQALASLARALADRLTLEALAHGLAIDTMPLAPLIQHARWLAVIVESPEHAHELASLLPDFVVVTAEEGKPPAPWGMQSPFRTLFTLCAAHDHQGFVPEIVINGVGGRYPLDIPPMIGTKGRLLVELADDFDERATNETSRRLQAYLMHGWRLLGARPYLPWATAGMVLNTTRTKKLPSYLEDALSNEAIAVGEG